MTAHVDAAMRAATVRNHSATHLMHKALREVLGDHVQQKGSLVNAERTRFDFAHNAPVTDAQIREIENRVNAEVLSNAAAQARVMDIESAQKTGAMMLFGEKYGETVRVLDIGSSRELCGGTHVQRTGDIGLFKVVAERRRGRWRAPSGGRDRRERPGTICKTWKTPWVWRPPRSKRPWPS